MNIEEKTATKLQGCRGSATSRRGKSGKLRGADEPGRKDYGGEDESPLTFEGSTREIGKKKGKSSSLLSQPNQLSRTGE